jgi:hypothetical protein
MADITRQQLDQLKAALAPLGAVKSVVFQGVGPGGADIFVVTFEKGKFEWRIGLGQDGRIAMVGLRPLAG